MTPRIPSTPPEAFLLIDHLASMCDISAELQALSMDIVLSPPTDTATPDKIGLRTFVKTARQLEYALIARALQARGRAQDLRRVDRRHKLMIALFLAGTTPLADAVEDFADPAGAAFHTGHDPLAYVRSRGLIPHDCGNLQGLIALECGPDFLIAGRIQLEPLIEMTAQFLDSLELCYDLQTDQFNGGSLNNGAGEGAGELAVDGTPPPRLGRTQIDRL